MRSPSTSSAQLKAIIRVTLPAEAILEDGPSFSYWFVSTSLTFLVRACVRRRQVFTSGPRWRSKNKQLVSTQVACRRFEPPARRNVASGMSRRSDIMFSPPSNAMGPSGKCISGFHRTSPWLPSSRDAKVGYDAEGFLCLRGPSNGGRRTSGRGGAGQAGRTIAAVP